MQHRSKSNAYAGSVFVKAVLGSAWRIRGVCFMRDKPMRAVLRQGLSARFAGQPLFGQLPENSILWLLNGVDALLPLPLNSCPPQGIRFKRDTDLSLGRFHETARLIRFLELNFRHLYVVNQRMPGRTSCFPASAGKCKSKCLTAPSQ